MALVEMGVSYIGCSEYLGTHKQIIDIYNQITPLPRGYRVKYSDAWCMAFVSACAWKVGAESRFPYECSCAKAVDKLAAEGLWTESDCYVPQKNDLIFYHWGTDSTDDCTAVPNHVGIVAGIKDGCIIVLEGNYHDAVGYREITLNHRYIRGFGRTSELFEGEPHDLEAVAYQVMSGKWGNMPERAELLESAGYDYPTIQARVNAIYEQQNPVRNDSLENVAISVIRGDWGYNPERKQRLIEAGYDYAAVQEYVNVIMEAR